MAETLDLTTSTDRATVNFDAGTFEIRHPREMTFAQTGKIVGLGKQLDKLTPNIDDSKILAEAQKIMQAITKILLVSIPKKALDTLTPDDMNSLLEFFNALRTTKSDEPDLSESASSSPPGVSDSTETEGAS